MPPTTSRDFQRAAGQRYEAALALFRKALYLDCQYLGGYTVECTLKSLILHATPKPSRQAKLKEITSGAKMHLYDTLVNELRSLGVTVPLMLVKRMRRLKWSTNLRYEVKRRDRGETAGFLKSAKIVYNWVEGQLP